MDKIQQAIAANLGNRLTQQLANGLFHDIRATVAEIEAGYRKQLAELQARLDEKQGAAEVTEATNGG